MEDSLQGRPKTANLNRQRQPIPFDPKQDIVYRPIPHRFTVDTANREHPVWRLRFDIVSQDPIVSFGVDVNDVIVLGRGEGLPNIIDLTPYGAADLGVSRRHLMIRPTDTNIYISDLGSTNGSLFNGLVIGVNSPHSLTGQDFLELGKCQLSVTVVQRPKTDTGELRRKADLADTLLKIGKAITSQLELDDVLRQVSMMAKSATSASVAEIWLIDEKTNELFLEAELGADDVPKIQRQHLPNNDRLVRKVVRTGELIRVKKPGNGKQGKATVECVMCAPLVLGGVTLGALSVTCEEKAVGFSDLDETLLVSVSEFAAIAIQNSRLVRATDKFLSFQVERLDAFDQITGALSASLNTSEFYQTLSELIREHWPVDEVELWITDETNNVLIPFADLATGKDINLKDLPKIGAGPLGEVAKSGEAKIVDIRLLKDPDVKRKDGDKGGTAPLGKRATLAHIPYLIRGQVVAILTLHIKENKSFKKEDIQRLQAATGMAAVAIQNMLLLTRSEGQHVIVKATADLLLFPLLIINKQGELIISNQAAEQLLKDWQEQWQVRSPKTGEINNSLALVNLIQELSGSVGRTKEIKVADNIYLSTIEHDTQIGTIILLQDITELRKLERIRADIIGTLAHDVRGPLTSIRGFARLQKDTRTTAGESRLYTDEIIQSTDRVIEMVEQLLDIEMLGSQEPELAELCDLVDIINKAVTDLKGVALEKEISLNKRLSGTPFSINANSIFLYRSVLNLVDNAIKYSPKKSPVEIELKYVPDEVSIIVRDEGKGITEEDMPRIFDKYFRAPASNQSVPGTGLGLAMVHATAIRFGGKVTVQNTEKGGAEFTISLPRDYKKV